jgi:long-chain acyl-CoA synthetase
MTESNATGFAATGAAYLHKPLSGGVITPIVDVKVVDENGNEVAQGERGEILLRSPTVVQGYWNKPDATAETFKDGWLITGDVGYLDDEGYIFLTDRIKDMIIRGGENIYSIEIESCILTRNDIMEAAAYGVPHDTLGEEVAVTIMPKPGVSISAEDIKEHVAAHLAGFKVPSYVTIQHEPLPKNATGKVLKKQLRDQFKAG